jgi:glycosyltransferase involved in cell wall biosynthesis
MSDKRKIVFIGFLPGYGGAEKSMIMIANGLATLGDNITVISLKDNNMVYEIDKRINYIFIPDHNGHKIRRQINRFIDLKVKLKEIKPDLVISFWLQPAIFSAILSKYIGFKSIYSERGDPTDKEYSGVLGFIREIAFRAIDGFVFQTKGAQQCFSIKTRNRSVVINNPVYIKYDDYFLPKVRRKKIVNVGRLHKQKNQDVLIQAFMRISDLFPEYTLNIYGDGELKKNFEKQIQEYAFEDRIILEGTTSNLFSEIHDSALFVLSSDYEGMPNALMEAMALGIPSISTDCKPGGARELITDKMNGLLVERNSIEALAVAMQYIIEHPEKAELMAKNAKEISLTHSYETIIKQWYEFLWDILKG